MASGEYDAEGFLRQQQDTTKKEDGNEESGTVCLAQPAASQNFLFDFPTPVLLTLELNDPATRSIGYKMEWPEFLAHGKATVLNGQEDQPYAFISVKPHIMPKGSTASRPSAVPMPPTSNIQVKQRTDPALPDGGKYRPAAGVAMTFSDTFTLEDDSATLIMADLTLRYTDTNEAKTSYNPVEVFIIKSTSNTVKVVNVVFSSPSSRLCRIVVVRKGNQPVTVEKGHVLGHVRSLEQDNMALAVNEYLTMVQGPDMAGIAEATRLDPPQKPKPRKKKLQLVYQPDQNWVPPPISADQVQLILKQCTKEARPVEEVAACHNISVDDIKMFAFNEDVALPNSKQRRNILRGRSGDGVKTNPNINKRSASGPPGSFRPRGKGPRLAGPGGPPPPAVALDMEIAQHEARLQVLRMEREIAAHEMHLHGLKMTRGGRGGGPRMMGRGGFGPRPGMFPPRGFRGGGGFRGPRPW